MVESIRTSTLFAASLGSLLIGYSLHLVPIVLSYVLEPSVAIIIISSILVIAALGTYLVFWGMRTGKLVMHLGAGTFIGINFILIGLLLAFFASYPLELVFSLVIGAFFAFLLDLSYRMETRYD